jgi:16S rRNA (cytosine1402-N4)-methyltransferase
MYHIPVLLTESVDGLDIRPNGTYVDVTLGGGGHSREILKRLNGTGHLYSFDQDEDAEKNWQEAAGAIPLTNFTFIRSNFRYLKNWMRYYGVEKIDGLLADLGVSSHHFDDKNRGFSFRFDAPLDMRMNKRAGVTAAEIVNKYEEERLANILYIYGEFKNSRKIASSISKVRKEKEIKTTMDLIYATNIKDKKDLARLFQALRIEVNQEMAALKEMLTDATQLLNPNGRLSIITYHSLEDRMVKNIIKKGNVEGKVNEDMYGKIKTPIKPISNKVITPSNEEIQNNPRSRSAKLRIGIKQ